MPVTQRTATSLTLDEAVPLKSKLLLLIIVVAACLAFLAAIFFPYQVCAVYSAIRDVNHRCPTWRDATLFDRIPFMAITGATAAIFLVAGLPSLLARNRIIIINRETSTVTTQTYPFVGKVRETASQYFEVMSYLSQATVNGQPRGNALHYLYFVDSAQNVVTYFTLGQHPHDETTYSDIKAFLGNQMSDGMPNLNKLMQHIFGNFVAKFRAFVPNHASSV